MLQLAYMKRESKLDTVVRIRLSPVDVYALGELAKMNQGTNSPDTVSHIVRTLIRREIAKRKVVLNLSPQATGQSN